MIKSSKEEFLKLKKFWYNRLLDTGFNDAEIIVDGKTCLRQTATHSLQHSDPFSRAMNEEYYRTIGRIIEDEKTVFRNTLDQYILKRHAEGARITDITNELVLMCSPLDRKTVRVIIRRYEMLWGLKNYTRKQLNLRPHPHIPS